MEQNETKYRRPTSKIWTGLFLVIAGILLLAQKMHAGIPDWFVSWPVLIIAIGILIGIQHKFRNFFWLIPVVWGSFALIDRLNPMLQLHNYTGPFAIILVGLYFIFRSRPPGYPGDWRKHWGGTKEEWKKNWHEMQDNFTNISADDFIDSTIIFSGEKRKILSKNFRGGDITCFMGGAEIDLSQADIQGAVRMDITTTFGGVKLIVPANWDIKKETTLLFGGIEDKRTVSATTDANKVLIIDGTVIFGGIEIRNY